VSEKLCDIGSERAVLSGICQYGEDTFIDISTIVNVNTFSNTRNQLLFNSLDNLFKSGIKQVDTPSLISQINSLGFADQLLDKQGIEYIGSLFNTKIHKENTIKQAAKIAVLGVGRTAQTKHIQAYNNLKEITGNESIDEVLSISEKPIFEMSLELAGMIKNDPELLSEGIDEYIQNLIDNPIENIGIPTPYPIYNNIIGGGIRTGVALICSRPKVGKTSFSKEVGLHVSSLGIPVLFLDSEMNKNDQLNRSLAGLADIDIKEIETGKFSKTIEGKLKVQKAAEYIKSLPYKHQRIAGKEFDEVISIIRRWIHKDVGFDDSGKTKPHLVLYDYFKLMNSAQINDSMKEYQVLGFQISKLADFCGEYQTPVLAFVQINRDGINKETSDIISGSDRLLWLCTSMSIFKRKTAEEIAEDGKENGNMKLIPVECRFGKPLDEGDYINLQMDHHKSKIKELKTQRSVVQDNKDEESGFSAEAEEVLF
jgi:replicative DNA helicase